MSEEIKRKATEILNNIEKVSNFTDTNTDINLAILSTKNTIDALNAVIRHDKERYGIISRGASIELGEQKEILKELESRI